MTRVLMVISAADRWTLKDGTVHPSGYWAEEAAMPYGIFSAAGWDITVATPGGNARRQRHVSVLTGSRCGVLTALTSVASLM